MFKTWHIFSRKIAIFLVRLFYNNLLARFMLPSCKFIPTCSDYACESLVAHGVLKGSWNSMKRILRCQPFSRGGYDPVR